MRRERNGYKFIIISLVVVSVLVALLIGTIISKNVRNSREKEFAGQMSKLSEELSESDTVSTKIGKSVEDVQNEVIEEEVALEDPKLNMEENKVEEKNKKISSVENKKDDEKKSKKTEEKAATETSSESKKDEKGKIKFEVPIKGEILREFAKESLVYSNTLQEWVTHNGVDIKADKTSVVKAAAGGTVLAIKNDPRYGLTVIITHDDGYQTVYSNLLTAEFVVKGEKVESGQTVGTVGNSASFEIEDEYHLHFASLEILPAINVLSLYFLFTKSFNFIFSSLKVAYISSLFFIKGIEPIITSDLLIASSSVLHLIIFLFSITSFEFSIPKTLTSFKSLAKLLARLLNRKSPPITEKFIITSLYNNILNILKKM